MTTCQVELIKRPLEEITVLSTEPRNDIYVQVYPSPNRPVRQTKRHSIYQGELPEPRKRIRK